MTVTYSGLQTFCVCSLVFLVSQCLYDSESRTPESHSSPLFSLASGPPKCDVSHLVVTRSALCSSAGVTCRYSVTPWHDVPLPEHTNRKSARHHQVPMSGYVHSARYIKTKLPSRTPWLSGRRTVGISSHDISKKDALGTRRYDTW